MFEAHVHVNIHILICSVAYLYSFLAFFNRIIYDLEAYRK